MASSIGVAVSLLFQQLAQEVVGPEGRLDLDRRGQISFEQLDGETEIAPGAEQDAGAVH